MKNWYKMRRLRFHLRNLFYGFNFIKPYQYQYISKEHLRFYLPAEPIMLDCGAHDGLDSIELVNTFGGTLYAVEAVPDVFSRLIENTKSHPNIHPYNLALGKKNEKINFYVSAGNSGASSSLLQPREHLRDHPEISFHENIRVDCFTLDKWAEDNKISRIDFMWLDMQGAEKLMLEASEQIIKTVKVIHCEISTKETYESVLIYPAFKKWMKTIGFRPEIELIPPGYDMGDVVFVRYK